MHELRQVGFGGGCHWCTEAVFQALRGVAEVRQGWIRSDPPHDTYSEAVIVVYDFASLPLEVLIDIHLRTHASGSAHALRGKYRSAVYTFGDAQHLEAADALARLAMAFDSPRVTQTLPHRGFRSSDARFQNYYATRPDRPFCRTYIDPKLAFLRRAFAAHVSD